MTCIVGIEYGGRVYLGSDSIASNGYSQIITTESKIFRNDSFVIGYTSSFRMGQLLQHKFIPPKQDNNDSDIKFLTTHFIDAVRTCFKDAGYSRTNKGEETAGTWMIGYRGKLYTIEDEYHILHSQCGYVSVGSGYLPALGSLHTTNKLSIEPKHRISLALAAAEKFIVTVGGPKNIIVSSKK